MQLVVIAFEKLLLKLNHMPLRLHHPFRAVSNLFSSMSSLTILYNLVT